MQQTLVGCAKSIAGIALIGLGIFVLYENLRQAATQLIHLLGGIPGEALGVLPTVILAASRVLQAYGGDHSRSLQGCVLHMLASSCPLLLVIVGTLLSGVCFCDDVSAHLRKEF